MSWPIDGAQLTTGCAWPKEVAQEEHAMEKVCASAAQSSGQRGGTQVQSSLLV